MRGVFQNYLLCRSTSLHRTPSLVVLPNGGALLTFCALVGTPRVALVPWFLLWLPSLRLSGLFRNLHISPQSEPSFDSVLEDSTHIADSLGQESLELLYESSFGARIFVCSLSGSRRFLRQDSEFYSFWTWGVLFGFLGRFLGFDMGHPVLKLGWSPLIKVFTGYENQWPIILLATALYGLWKINVSLCVFLSRAHNMYTFVIMYCRYQVPSSF